MSVADLPGYIQGYVFSDESQYYNSTDEYFIDQAGYSGLEGSRAVVAVGTPQFVDVNAARGIELDNTWHIYLNSPMAWYGSCIAVYGAPGWTPSGTQTVALLKGQAIANYSASPRIEMAYFSSNYRRRIATHSAASVANIDHISEPGIFAVAFALDQRMAQKRVEAMEADGTITVGNTQADDQVGEVMIGGTSDYDYPNQIIGNLTGLLDTTVYPNGNTLTLCELHFFSGLLTASPTTDVETELAALEAIYG